MFGARQFIWVARVLGGPPAHAPLPKYFGPTSNSILGRGSQTRDYAFAGNWSLVEIKNIFLLFFNIVSHIFFQETDFITYSRWPTGR